MNVFLEFTRLNSLQNGRRTNKDENFNTKFFSFLIAFFIIFLALVYGFIAMLFLKKGGMSEISYAAQKIIPSIMVAELILKFLFKKNQTLEILPYLRLPISHNRLFTYLLTKEFYVIYNFIFVIFLIPIVTGALSDMYSSRSCIGIFVFVYFISLLSSFLSNAFKTFYYKWNIYTSIVFLVFCGGLFLLIFKTNLFDLFFINVLNGNPVINIIVAFVLICAVWLLDFYVYNKFLYLQLENISENKETGISNINIFSGKSKLSYMLNFQIKQYLRTNFGKRMFIVSFVFLIVYLIGSFYFKNYVKDWLIFLLTNPYYYLCAMGFSCESTYFDRIITTSNSSLKNIIYSKIILSFLVSVFTLIIVSISFYFRHNINLFYKALSYFLIGAGPFCVIMISSFERISFRMITGKQTFVDKNAMKPSQMYMWIMMGFFLVLSVPGFFIKDNLMYLKISACVSIPFILSMKFWVNRAVKGFSANKYKCLKGFRG